jgi:hypothetical protein
MRPPAGFYGPWAWRLRRRAQKMEIGRSRPFGTFQNRTNEWARSTRNAPPLKLAPQASFLSQQEVTH